jgi:hypothetical protein
MVIVKCPSAAPLEIPHRIMMRCMSPLELWHHQAQIRLVPKLTRNFQAGSPPRDCPPAALPRSVRGRWTDLDDAGAGGARPWALCSVTRQFRTA